MRHRDLEPRVTTPSSGLAVSSVDKYACYRCVIGGPHYKGSFHRSGLLAMNDRTMHPNYLARDIPNERLDLTAEVSY